MEREQIILSSTHIDLHGMKMTKESLDNAVGMINSERNPRLGLEHDMSLPPLGRIIDAEVIQGKDGEYYLVAYKEFFKNRQKTILDDGTILYREYFEDNSKPFTEAKSEPCEFIEVKADPVNFESMDSMKEFIENLREESGIDFSKKMLIRKSHIPDPELVIKVTGIIAASVGIISSKITEKIGESVGEDIAKFYKLLRTSVIGMVKKAIPKLRPITFIIEVHNDDLLVELLIVSNKPDEVVNAFSSENLKSIREKIETSKTLFNAEKIQFFQNEDKNWELNYILCKDGSTIGTKKAFDKRDTAFKELIAKMIEKNKSNENSC